jgi:hypothetical protein
MGLEREALPAGLPDVSRTTGDRYADKNGVRKWVQQIQNY